MLQLENTSLFISLYPCHHFTYHIASMFLFSYSKINKSRSFTEQEMLPTKRVSIKGVQNVFLPSFGLSSSTVSWENCATKSAALNAWFFHCIQKQVLSYSFSINQYWLLVNSQFEFMTVKLLLLN